MTRRGVATIRILALLPLLATTLSARHLPIQVFTSAQGLPRDSVNCLVPGSTGLLWFCTSEGLARFDGYRFRVFGPDQGLPSRTIRDFVPSRSGGFWVVTDAGICRLPAGSKIGEPCRLLAVDRTAGDFTSIFESQSGQTYAATRTVLYQVSDDGRALQPTSMRLSPNDQIRTVADGNDGSLLVGSVGALFLWRPGAAPRSLSGSAGILGPLAILRLSATSFLLAATDGLYRMEQSGAGAAITRVALAGMQTTTCLARRRDGSIWAGGVGGVVRLALDADGAIRMAEHFTDDDGLPASDIDRLVEDVRGNLWGATDGSGVFRIEESGFTTYSTRDGLDNPRISSIFEDRSGGLIVETSWYHGPTVHTWKGGRFQTIAIRHPDGIPYFGWGWNQNVLPAHDGGWWVPAGPGLLRFPPLAQAGDLAHQAPAQHYLTPALLGCLDVFRLFEDSGGDVWIACVDPRQLVRWERGSATFRLWTAADGLPAGSIVTAIRESPGKTVWIATQSAAVRYRNGRFEAFALTPGNPTPEAKDLMIDHAGHIWIATEHAGLFRCDNPDDPRPNFRSYTVNEGLSTNAVRSLTEDRAGFVYAGTALGVDRIDPQAPLESRRIRHFTPAEGLPDSEQNTAFRDSRGHLWFGALHGLAEFDPEKAGREPAPDVYLTRIRVRGEEIPVPWEGARTVSLHLASDHNQVEIEYTGIDLHSAQSLRYQYRMIGVDPRWIDALDQRSVNYASLPGGSFQFEVRAVDPDGQFSPSPAAFHMAIAVPVWRQWWFVTFCIALLALATVTAYDYRIRNLLAMERLRTRIATDLHDDIGASLSQISILSEIALRDEPGPNIGAIAGIARGLVQDMSDIVWAVNPRHDRFDGLVHRMRRFAGDTLGDIRLEFEAGNLPHDSSVPLHIRRPLYLVFKEAVNNVARHSGASSAAIRLKVEGDTLLLTVEDDGRGFDPRGPHEGEGLASIARRSRDVGGSADWQPRPGGGTRFTAVLPLRTRATLVEWRGLFRRASR